HQSTAQVITTDINPFRLKYQNSDMKVDLAVGLWSSPLPLDFDNDGDLDLVISCTDVPFNGTWFFENMSGEMSSATLFSKPVKIGQGITNVTVSYVDGKPRILGSALEYTDFAKYVYGRPVGIFNAAEILSQHPRKRFNHWKYVDFENDGDLDLIVGIDDWAEYGWDNAFDRNGNWTRGDLHGYVYLIENDNGRYVSRGKLEAGNKPVDVYGNTSPNMEDFDGDGDLDIICGEFVDRFTWFENTGTRKNPVYAAGKFLENSKGLIRMDLEMMMPVAVDWNGDKFIDLIVGDEDGRIAFIENTGSVKNNMPLFKSPVYFKQDADLVKFGALVTPFSVDWDDDGDEDLVCGNSAGYIGFIENMNGAVSPAWNEPVLLKADGEVIRIMAGENGSIQGPCERKWGYTTLSVADWDGDGLKDILINSIWGKVEWYKNTGKKGSPILTKMGGVAVDWKGQIVPKPKWNWWTPAQDELSTQWRTTPYAIDWNKDGLMDLVMLDHEGYLAFFERFAKNGKLFLLPGKRIFRDADLDNGNGLLRLNIKEAGGSGRRKFCMADWDKDGDLDILLDSKNILFIENTGEKDGNPVYKRRAEVMDIRLAGHDTSPTIVDWNKDGKPDLLIGAEDGHFYYSESK
ncbi:MAG TPA: VCBS repeat-containing protein, partial [Prolixibacteraceae bacterium]|nr:VCBS repeat-containing protein [Prolixibacteraceae bacterium]